LLIQRGFTALLQPNPTKITHLLENTIHEEIGENMITLRGVHAVNNNYKADKEKLEVMSQINRRRK
jgi:hypothetical protein